MRHRPRRRRTGEALAVALLLGACGGARPSPPASPAPADPCASASDCPAPKKVSHVTVALPRGSVAHRVARPSIRVRFVVERDGRVSRLEVLEPLRAEPPWPELQEGALEAVRQWRYEPPHCDGKPAAVCVTETITVELSGDPAGSPRP